MERVSIEKYKQLYKTEFGIELSFDEAAEQAERLLMAARVITQPMPIQFLPRYRELLVHKKKPFQSH